MIITAQQTPQRLSRTFNTPTRLEFQVKGPATITLAKEQGQLSGASANGLALTSASTSPPWGTWVTGELWYISDIPNGIFDVEMMMAESQRGGCK